MSSDPPGGLMEILPLQVEGLVWSFFLRGKASNVNGKQFHHQFVFFHGKTHISISILYLYINESSKF